MDTADAELEVQMWPGGGASGTDRTDALALLNRLAFFDIDFAEVRVQSAVTVAVADLDHLAVAA